MRNAKIGTSGRRHCLIGRQKHIPIPASLARDDDPFAMDGTVLSKYGRVTLVRQLGISRREGASHRVGNRG